jgi:serine/threonine-protein kinase
MGVILGTAPYMSPEQARGKSVDKRTDIWAFGCCLYEALTGKRAFEGETVTDTLAAIVKNEPEWDRLPPGTPSSVRKLMQRCLRKDPSTRLRDPWDVRVLMEVDDDNVPAVTPKRPLVAPTLIAGALLGAIVVWATLGVGSTPDSRTTRLEIYLEEGGLQYVNTASVPLAISPDGSSLVYVTRVGSASQLFLRSLDTYDARAIPNTEGALAPFFSPDGHWIGFLGSDTVNKISLQGSGRLAVVSDDRVGAAASWGDDGHILYSGRAGLYSVSENGGEPIIVAKDEVYGFPERLPGGRGFLCTVVADGEARIGVISSRTGEWKVLDVLGEGTTPKYLPTGHIVYGSGGTILAAPFDISRAEITGVPTPVVTGVASRSNRLMGEYAFYAVSSSGHLAYVPGGISIQRRLVWVDRYGRESPLRTEAGPYEYPAVSPDGSRIAYTRHDSDHDSWLYHLERLTETRLTNEGGSGNVWTPDGQRITLGFGTEYDIYLQDTEARGEAELLIPRANSLRPGIWSPDGLDLIYVAADDAGNRDIWVRRANGETSRLVDSRFDEYQPALSPDGRLIAYVSTQSGAEEVYVQPYPQLDRRWLISRGGGREPRWSPQGNELFYRLDRLVLAVTTRATPEFSASVPETLFEGDFHIEPGNMDNPDYDIHPDGERFLMIKNEEPHRRIRVVLNWFDELERLVPIL